MPGVTRAWQYPGVDGLGTVGVRFVMDNKSGTIIPDAGEVATVQAYLDTKAPVTADVRVYAPRARALHLMLSVTPDTPDVRAAVKAELEDLLRREGKPGVTIYLSQINEAISIAPGETNHSLIVPMGDVTHTAGEIPELGMITWI